MQTKLLGLGLIAAVTMSGQVKASDKLLIKQEAGFFHGNDKHIVCEIHESTVRNTWFEGTSVMKEVSKPAKFDLSRVQKLIKLAARAEVSSQFGGTYDRYQNALVYEEGVEPYSLFSNDEHGQSYKDLGVPEVYELTNLVDAACSSLGYENEKQDLSVVEFQSPLRLSNASNLVKVEVTELLSESGPSKCLVLGVEVHNFKANGKFEAKNSDPDVLRQVCVAIDANGDKTYQFDTSMGMHVLRGKLLKASKWQFFGTMGIRKPVFIQLNEK